MKKKKKEIQKLKSAISKRKMLPDGLSSRLEMTEDRDTELEEIR